MWHHILQLLQKTRGCSLICNWQIKTNILYYLDSWQSCGSVVIWVWFYVPRCQALLLIKLYEAKRTKF